MGKNTYKNKLLGFSLFEVLITIGILMTLSLLVFPLAINKTQETKLESYASTLVTDIYYQQQRSALKNISGGVSMGVSTYTLFDGESLATATDTDIKRLPGNIRIVNGEDIFFNQGEFKPVTDAMFTITDGTYHVTVYINREGLIGYEKL